eukprot:gene36749-47906_t
MSGSSLSFKFDLKADKQDRWWIAPSFYSTVDEIPVETQLMLVEDNQGKKSVTADDGELSGAQIDSTLAAEKLVTDSNPFIQYVHTLASQFYVKFVEQGDSNSISVHTWAYLSKTLFKDKLVEFFDTQTDFSKRLVSWRANSKFEDIDKGTTLKGFVGSLKTDFDVHAVYFWHALSGYWGGVSENVNDDLTKALLGSTISSSVGLISTPEKDGEVGMLINGGSSSDDVNDIVNKDRGGGGGGGGWFSRLLRRKGEDSE